MVHASPGCHKHLQALTASERLATLCCKKWRVWDRGQAPGHLKFKILERRLLQYRTVPYQALPILLLLLACILLLPACTPEGAAEQLRRIGCRRSDGGHAFTGEVAQQPQPGQLPHKHALLGTCMHEQDVPNHRQAQPSYIVMPPPRFQPRTCTILNCNLDSSVLDGN